jgi:hypothetical protein
MMSDYFTQARAAYDAELADCPRYQDGSPRPTWDELRPVAQWWRAVIEKRRATT